MSASDVRKRTADVEQAPSYEQQRLMNIARNQQQLVELGLDPEERLCKKARQPARPRQQPRLLPPEASRRSSRLEAAPPRNYAEDGRRADMSELPPGTKLDMPARRAPKVKRLADPGAPAELPPPLPSEEEEAAQVAKARALYREHFVRVREATGGGRADLAAMSALGQMGIACCVGRDLGQLPGMPPGTEFYNKAEMQVCGMHRKWLSGIDYVPATQSSDGESIARAIVSSGG